MADNIGSIKGLASDYVYKILYDKIMSIELAPGASVSPAKLSKELGISRTPIQRASTQLAENGLLEILPQRGSYVSLINAKKVSESFYMRNLLEQAAIYRVCSLSNKADVALLLEQNIYDQQKALDTGLYEESYKLDDAFHHIIYKAADMLYIEQSMMQFSIDQNRLRQLRILSNLLSYPTLKQLQEVVYSVRDSNADAASFNIYANLSLFTDDIIEIHKKYPDYFSNWTDEQKIKHSLQKQSFYNFY